MATRSIPQYIRLECVDEAEAKAALPTLARAPEGEWFGNVADV
jgi:hypothetical protein